MNPIRNRPMPAADFASDPGSFEKLWHELDALEQQLVTSELPCRKVRLECDGDLVDLASVRLVGRRDSGLSGADLVEFVCPRCLDTHESLRFR